MIINPITFQNNKPFSSISLPIRLFAEAEAEAEATDRQVHEQRSYLDNEGNGGRAGGTEGAGGRGVARGSCDPATCKLENCKPHS